MKNLMILAVLLLVGCAGAGQTQLRITCADGGGFGSWIGLGGKVNAMTHTTPDHVFTDGELELFKNTCPRDNEVASMLQDLLVTQRSQPQTSPQ